MAGKKLLPHKEKERVYWWFYEERSVPIVPKSFVSMFRVYASVPPPFLLLSLVAIVPGLSIFVNAFTTLYTKEYMGLSSEEGGMLVSLVALGYMGGSLLGGYLGDHLGHRNTFLITLPLSAFLYAITGFFLFEPYSMALIIVATISSATLLPLVQVLAAGTVTRDKRKVAMPLLTLFFSCGCTVASALVGFLFVTYPQWLFFGFAAIAWIATSLILTTRHWFLSSRYHSDPQHEGEIASPHGLLRVILSRPLIAILFACLVSFAFIYAQSSFSLPQALKATKSEEGGELYYGWIMSLSSIVVMTATLPLSYYTRRFPSLLLVAAGGVLHGVGFSMLLLGHYSPLYLILSTVLWSSGRVLSSPNSIVAVVNNAPTTHRGRLVSCLPLTLGAGYVLAPLLSGSIIHRAGFDAVWWLCLVLGTGMASTLVIARSLIQARKRRSITLDELGVVSRSSKGKNSKK